jgi:4-amino-4-deoxy-L-arabinose transferase-like glycosyltransferase
VLTGRGLPKSSDSYWYISYACGLLDNFSIGLNIDEVLYLGYNLLLALLLGLFKSSVTVVLIQAVTASLAIILVYRIALLLFNRATAVWAGLFYLYIWDITLWSTYVLSDSFFVSLLLLCVYLLLRAMEPGGGWRKSVFVVTALYMCVFRPTGALIMATMVLYIVSRLDKKKMAAFLTKYKCWWGSFLGALIVLTGYLYSRSIFDPLIHSLQYNAKLVLYNVYAKGWIYDIPTAYDFFFRPDYSINIGNSLVLSFLANNWESITVLYARRAVAFLGAWTWQIPIRNWVDIMYFAFKLLPAGLFVIGTIAAMRNGKFGQAAILWLIIFAVFSFCVLLFIDAMYRYRFPAMPFIAMVVAYGLDRAISGGWSFAKKYRTLG